MTSTSPFPPYHLLNTVLHSNTVDNDTYVKSMRLTTTNQQHFLALNCSDNCIRLYAVDLPTGKLEYSATIRLPHNAGSINDIQFVDSQPTSYLPTDVKQAVSDNPYLLVALDSGAVHVYDIRSSLATAAIGATVVTSPNVQPVDHSLLNAASNNTNSTDQQQHIPISTFHTPNRQPVLTAASCGGNLVVGTEGGVIYIWEMQSATLIATLELHTDDVTSIQFAPTSTHHTTPTGSAQQPSTAPSAPTVIYSAGEDGLIHQIIPGQVPAIEEGMEDVDPTLTADIEDAWVGVVLPIEQSIKRFGFFGPAGEYMYVISSSETLSLWYIATGERISEEFINVRQQLSEAFNVQVDYLIDCYYEQRTQRLFLAAGTNDGRVMTAHVTTKQIQPCGIAGQHQAAATYNPATLHHTATVRDCVWWMDTLLTAGEDYRLCAWSSNADAVDSIRLQKQQQAIERQLEATMNNDDATNDADEPDTAPHVHLPDGSCCIDAPTTQTRPHGHAHTKPLSNGFSHAGIKRNSAEPDVDMTRTAHIQSRPKLSNDG